MKNAVIFLSMLVVALSAPLQKTNTAEDEHYEDQSDFINDETEREFGLPNKYDAATFIKDVTAFSEETAEKPIEFEDAENDDEESDDDVIPDSENEEDDVLTEMDSELLNEPQETPQSDEQEEDLSEIGEFNDESFIDSMDDPLVSAAPEEGTNDEPCPSCKDDTLEDEDKLTDNEDEDELTDNEDEATEEEHYQLPEGTETQDEPLQKEAVANDVKQLSEDSTKEETTIVSEALGHDDPYENLFL